MSLSFFKAKDFTDQLRAFKSVARGQTENTALLKHQAKWQDPQSISPHHTAKNSDPVTRTA